MAFTKQDFQLSDEEFAKVNKVIEEIDSQMEQEGESIVDLNVVFTFTPFGRKISLTANENTIVKEVL